MMVCVGDSITYGQHVERDETWVSLLGGINRGVCGDTTRLGLERFMRDVGENPGTVVIQFGLNDCNRWDTDHGLPRVSVRAFEANLHEMVARSRRLRAQRVVLVSLTPCTRLSLFAPSMYVEKVARVARDTGAVLFRPILSLDHLLDGVHLTRQGHRVFASQLGEMLCQA